MVLTTEKNLFDETSQQFKKTTSLEDSRYSTNKGTNWFARDIQSPIHTGKYRAYFEADMDDGGFVITIPTLKGCITEAENEEDAYEFIKNALEGWIAVAQEKGLEIPEPDIP